MSFNFGAVFRIFFGLALVAMSAEILYRRFAWNQIPTQLSPWLVYGVLLVNGFLVGRLFLRRESSTKTGKN